jgi:hypothetical protein
MWQMAAHCRCGSKLLADLCWLCISVPRTDTVLLFYLLPVTKKPLLLLALLLHCSLCSWLASPAPQPPAVCGRTAAALMPRCLGPARALQGLCCCWAPGRATCGWSTLWGSRRWCHWTTQVSLQCVHSHGGCVCSSCLAVFTGERMPNGCIACGMS